MKKFVFLVCCSLLIFSCTKELETIDTNVDISDPVLGKLVTVRGEVRDSSRNPIALATVVAVFGQFRSETTTRPDGSYTLQIPESQNVGTILATKENFSNSFVRFSLGNEQIRQHVVIPVPGKKVQAELKNFSLSEVFTIRGRVTDQGGSPQANFPLLIFGFGSQVPGGSENLGFTHTDDQGEYELSGLRANYERTGLLTYVVQGNCRRLFSKIIEVGPDDVTIADDFQLDLSDGGGMVDIQIKPDACDENLMRFAFVVEPFISNFAGGSIEDEYSLPYCNVNAGGLYYAGVYTLGTGRHFDGGFYPIQENGVMHQFKPCRSEGAFFDAQIGDQIFSTSVQYNSSTRTFSGAAGSGVTVRIKLGQFPRFTQSTDGFNTIVSFGEIEEIELDYQGARYIQTGEQNYYFFNYGPGNAPAGIFQSVVQAPNGESRSFRAAFRLNQ